MDLSEKNLIIIKFGYNEGFDMDGFVANLMKESNLYFTDTENNIILDKADKVIITGNSNIATVNSLAYLVKTKGVPENKEFNSVVNIKSMF